MKSEPFSFRAATHTLPDPVGKTKTVKDLKATTLQAISLAAKDLGVPLVDDASFDTAMCHPSCRHQAMA
jgi:hypothetical protein